MTQTDALVLTDVLADEMGYLRDLHDEEELTGEHIDQAYKKMVKAVIDLVKE